MLPWKRAACALTLSLAWGCGGSSAGIEAGDEAEGLSRAVSATRPVLNECLGRDFGPLPRQPWRKLLTPVVTAAGAPNHSAQDQILPPGRAGRLEGKFTYGSVGKDLEGERVAVFLDDCKSWRRLGTAITDGDGRASIPVPTDLAPGIYEVQFQVLGDQSAVSARLWVLPVSTRIVVTDIDGTLTQGDDELVHQLLEGSYQPAAYPGAAALTWAHRDQNYVVLYLTGRPYWLLKKTRAWLDELSFAPGPLRVADNHVDAVPTTAGVGAYKREYLRLLIARGYELDLAYGNASTDIFAYLGAGFPAQDVWIIGPNAGEQETRPVTGSWEPRADELRTKPAISQPFRW